MLESIGKLQKFKKNIEQAKNFTIFIYAHHKTLSLMRSFTKKRDIVRPGVTRFASSFLTLQSMMEKKSQLKAMFCSELWDQCKWSNTTKGQKAYATVMSTSFWNGVTTCLKVFAPLVKVLRLVDGDKKPAMAKEKNVDVLLVTDAEATNAQEWIVEGCADDEVEPGTGLTWQLNTEKKSLIMMNSLTLIILGKPIDDNKDGSLTIRSRKFFNEIHGYCNTP
ncbi:hypothetical protein ACOSQ3_014998 [Xanthoceras sorbifolium]